MRDVVGMSPTHRRYVATRHGGPEARVRRALADALQELKLDGREDAARAMVDAGLSDRVTRYERGVDRLLDGLAGTVVAQAKPLADEVAAIHEAVRRHQVERLASAPRIDGLIRGPVPAP